MPYKLKGNCVVKADTGKVVKCHDTHEKALKHLAALEINVMGAEKSNDTPVRNVLEGAIHQSFTDAADQLFRRGYIDREQRLFLSSGIGDALKNFGDQLGAMGDVLVDAECADEIAEKESPMMMKCPDCGAKLKTGMTECPDCGAMFKAPVKEGMQVMTKELKPGDYLVTDAAGQGHLPITKTAGGPPDRGLAGAAWAALFSPAGFRGNKYEGPNKAKAQAKLKKIYAENDWPEPASGGKEVKLLQLSSQIINPNLLNHGIKAVVSPAGKELLVLWTMNAFEDREGEAFSTKAIQDYVDRHDVNPQAKDRVWFWHVKGTDFATIEWQDMVGRFLVEVAAVDDTAYGHKMFNAIQHPEQHRDVLPQGWGTSHGYLYSGADRLDRVYDFFEKYETTVLPAERASNPYGGIKEVIGMDKKNEAKKLAALAGLVGDEAAAKAINDPKVASKVLEALGVGHKEVDEEAEVTSEEETEPETVPNAEETETEPEETPAADAAQVQEIELDEELVKEIAGEVAKQMDLPTIIKNTIAATVKEMGVTKDTLVTDVVAAVKEALSTDVEAALKGNKEAVASQVLSGKLKLRPYSPTTARDNVLAGGAKALPDAADEKDDKKTPEQRGNTLVHNLASGMLKGTVG